MRVIARLGRNGGECLVDRIDDALRGSSFDPALAFLSHLILSVSRKTTRTRELLSLFKSLASPLLCTFDASAKNPGIPFHRAFSLQCCAPA